MLPRGYQTPKEKEHEVLRAVFEIYERALFWYAKRPKKSRVGSRVAKKALLQAREEMIRQLKN